MGFKDDATRPRICLAKHPDVLSNQPYVSACKDAVNRAAMQKVQANTRQQQSAREAGPSAAGRLTRAACPLPVNDLLLPRAAPALI